MSDVASGARGSGEEREPYVPTGARRSSFTPPPADAEPPVFDDDALADALAAQVAPFTAPIPVATPAPEPADPIEPPSFAPPAPTPSTESGESEPPTSPTLEAIERLESELRRRAEQQAASTGAVDQVPPVAPPAVAPPGDAPPPTDRRFPAPPTYLRPAPPEPLREPEDDATEREHTDPGSDIPVWAPPPASEPIVLPDPPTPAPPVSEPTWAPQDAEPAPAAEDAEPLDPPFWESTPPPNFAPPPLVEPPAPTTGSFPAFAPHPETPAFGTPPATPPVDLPPPGTIGPADYAHLPPPVGLEPAALPPYQPEGEPPLPPAPIDQTPRPLAPPPADFAALLGGAPPVHPDDLGGAPGGFPPPGAGSPFAPPEPESAPESELDDAVDEVDRVFGTGALPVDSTGAVAVVQPPSEPIPTVKVTAGEEPLLDPEPQQHPALAIEAAGPEPTPLDLRAGRAARMFWLWFAANSSVLSLSLGAVLSGLGMNLRQSIVAVVIGVALSFLPLGLGTLAGKWTGQPTMVVSRATFGLVGNAVPTLLAILSRVFWGGALLWLLATGLARVLVDAGLDAGLGEAAWTYVGLGGGFLIAFVVAVFGYGLVARVQLVLSILTAVLVVGVIVLTSSRVDLDTALLADDGPWVLLVSGAVLVFSVVGLAWVHSTGDVARYQRPDGYGGSTMFSGALGATLPALVLIAWGALLAASDPVIADGLATNPLYTIAALLPVWYPAPLIAALALGLLSGAVLTIYSGGFALQALGGRARRSVTTIVAGVLVLAAGAGLLLLAGDARDLIREVATTIAVPVAAWAGLFGAEVIIRSRFASVLDSDSLLHRGGVYPAVRWVNLIGFVLISAAGFGLTSAALPGLDWQGYLFPLLGLAGDDLLTASDVGVLVALVLGLLLPLATAIPFIRREHRALGDEPAAP